MVWDGVIRGRYTSSIRNIYGVVLCRGFSYRGVEHKVEIAKGLSKFEGQFLRNGREHGSDCSGQGLCN